MTTIIETYQGGVLETELTYDDIPKYSRCKYKGVPGFVIDKGPHIVSTNGNHLLIELDEVSDDDPVFYDEIKLKENLVNKLLARQEKLWIDFEDTVLDY